VLVSSNGGVEVLSPPPVAARIANRTKGARRASEIHQVVFDPHPPPVSAQAAIRFKPIGDLEQFTVMLSSVARRAASPILFAVSR
jgi:hypothetical protein